MFLQRVTDIEIYIFRMKQSLLKLRLKGKKKRQIIAIQINFKIYAICGVVELF